LKNLKKSNNELVELFVTGKHLLAAVLRVLCFAATKGNVFPVEPYLPGSRCTAVVFYPDDTIGLG
jgi:hypothetical protein